jgi:hypothetical protein
MRLAPLVLSATLATSALAPSAHAEDFDMTRLGKVDMSQKTVCVQTYTAPDAEVFARLSPAVFDRVTAFYDQFGIHLMFMPIDSLRYASKDAKVVAFFQHESYCKSLGGAECSTYATSAPHRDTTIMDIDPDYRTSLLTMERLPDEELAERWAATLAHELGHQLGLIHTYRSKLDGIGSRVGVARNLMDDRFLTSLDQMDLAPLQVTQLFSYVNRGKVYRLVHHDFLFWRVDEVDKAIAKNRAK